MSDEEDEIEISSDIVWTFNNAKDFPRSKPFTDQLITAGGSYEWKLEFYPNGLTSNRVTICLTLKEISNKVPDNVDAKINYEIIDLKKQKTFSGKISRRTFKKNSTEMNSTFRDIIFQDSESNFIISVEISQYFNQITTRYLRKEMTHALDDEEPAINSEVVWSFHNVHAQLLDAYPKGKAMTESLTTVDGYEWQIEFYPNGTDLTENKINVRLVLKHGGGSVESVDAECNYYFVDKTLQKNFAGKIARRNFKPDVGEEDADFENTILRECSTDCLITFCISQFFEAEKEIQNSNLLSHSKEAAEENVADSQKALFVEEDLKVESVKQLY